MNVGSVSFGSKYFSKYIQRDVVEQNGEKVHRTRYYSPQGNLIGFKIQHENGVVDFARESHRANKPKITIITRGYKNYNPVIAKVLTDQGDFFENIEIERKKGHNPSVAAVIKAMEEHGLFLKKTNKITKEEEK